MRAFSCFKKHRGISQILGSLILLAIVSSVGSVILIHAMGEIGAFNNKLTLFENSRFESVQEDVVFEHIQFNGTGNNLIITIRNSGTVETTINSISMMKMDTQDLILRDIGSKNFMLIQNVTTITKNAMLTEGTGNWNDPFYLNKEYKISITTTRGNFFDTVVRPEI